MAETEEKRSTVTNLDLASTSSSDSSEDEEEARKIREAICDESIFSGPKTIGHNPTTAQTKLERTRQSHLQANGEQRKPLKSNRPQDKNDDDNDNNLQTTPEFRSYVAKQLSQLLDMELVSNLSDKIWSTPHANRCSNERAGIRLFSDSKTLLKKDDSVCASGAAQSVVTTLTAASKPKKRRLSTSSESSEDERISACVFSVTDIHQENERLTMIGENSISSSQAENNGIAIKQSFTTKYDTDLSLKQALSNATDSVYQNGDGLRKKKKKKKAKKKKKMVEEEGIT